MWAVVDLECRLRRCVRHAASHIQPVAGWSVTDDLIEQAILRLMECDPDDALKRIQGYE